MKELRLLGFLLSRSLFTRGPIPVLILSVRSPPRQDRRVCAGMLLSRWHPISGLSHRKTQALPCSQGTLVPLPCSFRSRSGLHARSYGVSILPPLLRYEGPNVQPVIGIQSHGFGTRCLRFMPPSRTTMQDSLRCGDHPFTHGIYTRRVPIERFSCSMSYVISHPPRSLRFHGATERLACFVRKQKA